MKNRLILLLGLTFSLLFNFRGQSQQTTLKFIGSDNKFALNGIGDIQGIKGDNAKLAYWTISNPANFETKVYLKFLKSGRGGIIIRDANATNNLQGGRPCYYLYVDVSTSKLKLESRSTVNTLLSLLNSVSVMTTQNMWLSLKKENNKLTARYSYDAEATQNVTWTTLATIDNAFLNYNDYVRGVVVASGSKVNSNAAIFSNWKEPVSITPTTLCGIANNTLLATKGGYSAYARIYDNKLWVCMLVNATNDQFVVRGVNWIDNTAVKAFTGSYSCFEGQSTGFWGNVEPDGFNIPVGYKLTVQSDGSKVYSIGTNVSVDAPSITSSPSPALEKIATSFTVTNCTGTYAIYRNGNVVSNSSFLSVANPTLNDIYKAKCIVSGTESAFSNEITINASVVTGTGGSVNTLADMTIPESTKWNYFDPDIIPNFVTAKSTDLKTNQVLPNKWFIWHSPYRNLFGIGDSEASRLTKMLNKGVTAWNMSKLPAYTSALSTIITPERLVTENYGLGDNRSTLHPEEASYTAWIAWAKGGVLNASSFGITPVNGKYNQLLTISDYEAAYTNLANQMSANYHAVALNSMADVAVGRVGFQYGLGENTGGYYISTLYNGSNNVWATPADNTVPTQFIGKSAASNNRIVGVNEITYSLEAILPEDYQVQDQTNTNWFRIKHFGKELNGNYSGGQLDQCNAQHWATNVGVGTETAVNIHRAYPNGGQDVIVQLKNNNETDNGFHYDERYKEFRDNKYASYVNRYAITNIRDKYVDGVKVGTEEYLAPMGSENITNFIAEGQTMLAYFCGAKGINLWNSDFKDDAIPKDKAGNPRRGAKYNDVNYGNRDLQSYLYMLKALWRLNQKVDLGNGQSYSFTEICDGTEIYLNQNTKVVYPNSSSITQLRALDWQILKRSPVRAVVNTAKNVVFVIAFQAYGVEDNTVTFKLNDYSANISEVIELPVGKIIVKAYPLVNGTSQGTSIIAPAITTNVSSPSQGQSVTLTSTGCSTNETNKWYDNQEGNYLQSGLTYTVNAVNGNGYYSKCVSSTASSVKSNIITFVISTSTSAYVDVFILAGESNAGTRNISSTLTNSEKGLRNGTLIWNNNTNVLETLNVGVNNGLDENEAISGGWGMEVELANLKTNGSFANDIVIIKTAQGGARIGNYNSDITNPSPNYFEKTISRIQGVKTALSSQGKIPVFHVLYSQGLNNATTDGRLLTDNTHFGNLSGVAYWKAATLLYSSKIRLVTGDNTQITYMKFFGTYGDYLNTTIQEIANTNSLNSTIETSDLGIQNDGLHIGAEGIRTATRRYVATFAIGGTNTTPSTGTTGVTITEPNKAQYYFSAGHAPSYYDNNLNSPSIFTNAARYDADNDLVWLKNDKIKIAVNLKRGGQIAWASLINETSNLVYNGYDGGVQIQLDAYQKRDGYVQNGKYSRFQYDASYQYSNSTTSPAPNNISSYNVTQGGDFNNHAVSLIDYHKVGTDGYYVKLRPNFYTLDAELSQTYIEVTYKLVGYSLKIDYIYTSYRTDGQYDGSGFDAGHAPVCFLVNNLRKYKTYTGNQPFTRSNKYNDLDDGDLPNKTLGQSTSGTPLTKNSKEKWSLVYNPDNNKTIGVYSVTSDTEGSFSLAQENVFDGNGTRLGGEYGGGYTILGRNYDLVPFNSTFNRSSFSKTITSYLIVTPNTNTFIDEVYSIKANQN